MHKAIVFHKDSTEFLEINTVFSKPEVFIRNINNKLLCNFVFTVVASYLAENACHYATLSISQIRG